MVTIWKGNDSAEDKMHLYQYLFQHSHKGPYYFFLNCEQTAFSMKYMLNFIQFSYMIQKSFCASMIQLEYQLHIQEYKYKIMMLYWRFLVVYQNASHSVYTWEKRVCGPFGSMGIKVRHGADHVLQAIRIPESHWV